jgi:hypothetical protein
VAPAETLPSIFDATKRERKKLQPFTFGSYYISGCQLERIFQKTNALTLLSNSQLAIASKLNKIPEQTCITTI